MNFAIFDWAGNHLYTHGTFPTFEDAWDYIKGDMADKLGLSEEDYNEFDVRVLDERR